MMGTQAEAARLFYDFRLDDHVPRDHQLRGIDRHLDLDGIRTALKPFYSSTGRPSVDPELMIRMLLVGYCLGIRSERRLCAFDGARQRSVADFFNEIDPKRTLSKARSTD